MNQQFLRYYLPACLLSGVAVLLQIPMAKPFFLLHMWGGLALLVILQLKTILKWWRASDFDFEKTRYKYLIVFYTSSMAILLFFMFLAML
jgi:hypothetical protein